MDCNKPKKCKPASSFNRYEDKDKSYLGSFDASFARIYNFRKNRLIKLEKDKLCFRS